MTKEREPRSWSWKDVVREAAQEETKPVPPPASRAQRVLPPEEALSRQIARLPTTLRGYIEELVRRSVMREIGTTSDGSRLHLEPVDGGRRYWLEPGENPEEGAGAGLRLVWDSTAAGDMRVLEMVLRHERQLAQAAEVCET